MPAVEFGSSLLQSDEVQRTKLLKVLTEVVKTQQPMVFAPDPQVQAAPPEANRTPYPFIHVPLFMVCESCSILKMNGKVGASF